MPPPRGATIGGRRRPRRRVEARDRTRNTRCSRRSAPAAPCSPSPALDAATAASARTRSRLAHPRASVAAALPSRGLLLRARPQPPRPPGALAASPARTRCGCCLRTRPQLPPPPRPPARARGHRLALAASRARRGWEDRLTHALSIPSGYKGNFLFSKTFFYFLCNSLTQNVGPIKRLSQVRVDGWFRFKSEGKTTIPKK